MAAQGVPPSEFSARLLGLLERVVELQEQQVHLARASLDLPPLPAFASALRTPPRAADSELPPRPAPGHRGCAGEDLVVTTELPGTPCTDPHPEPPQEERPAWTSLSHKARSVGHGRFPAAAAAAATARAAGQQASSLGGGPSFEAPPATAAKPLAAPVASGEVTVDEPVVNKRLSTFVFKQVARTMTGTILNEASSLPEAVPNSVKYFLCSLGLLPARSFSGWKRVAYRLLRVALALMFPIRILCEAVLSYLRLVVVRSGFASEPVGLVVGVTSCLLWLTLMKQLETGGAALALLHDMTRRGFCWDRTARTAKSVPCVAFFFWGLVIFMAVRGWQGGQTLCQDALAMGAFPLHTCAVISSMSHAGIMALLYMIFGLVWTTRLFCALHKHELMWYASTLAEVLAQDQNQSELMQQLSTAQLSVTGRLRQASSSWVQAVLVFLACLCLNLLVIMTYLMSGAELVLHSVISAKIVLMVQLVLITALGLPLAQVAEVFEYDVLHALNNPLVVKNAQRHFGQQLLSHLHTLGWGFRFGQTVINLRLVMNILCALLITIVTSVSQAILKHIQ